MNPEVEKIIEILIKGKYISEEDVGKAKLEASKNRSNVLTYLLENNYLSPDIIGQAIAEFLGVPYADLNSNSPDREQVQLIPEEMARKYRVTVFKLDKDSVTISSSQPNNLELVEKVKTLFPNKGINIAYSNDVDIEKSFIHYKKGLSSRISEIIKSEQRVAPEMAREIILEALDLNASDIHFEPQEREAVVRFRLDGILHEVGKMSKKYYETIVNYLKVLSSLRIDEHQMAQDGAIRFKELGKEGTVDIRISIIPIVLGEKIVLRILSRHVGNLSIENIGLSQRDLQILKQSIKKPFGMIVVSGPTGSGKTTSLYTMLRKINSPEINITSIEDPVEYIMDGANQIQVNTSTEITFAKGLRSIVRQDPDVILVGEIRDRETAEISVNAALTGHLLFSTFHANNASTTFLRLIDMGVENYLLASTLNLVIAQRLLRKICEKCRYSFKVNEDLARKLPPDFRKYLKIGQNAYQGKGCPSCNGTGYSGRTAVFELIQITPEIQQLILKNTTSREIWEMAKNQGSRSLFEDAYEKAKLGITTFEEVFRVVPPE